MLLNGRTFSASSSPSNMRQTDSHDEFIHEAATDFNLLDEAIMQEGSFLGEEALLSQFYVIPRYRKVLSMGQGQSDWVMYSSICLTCESDDECSSEYLLFQKVSECFASRQDEGILTPYTELDGGSISHVHNLKRNSDKLQVCPLHYYVP
jgi:hypothetical protein